VAACPICSEENPATARFCQACGARLTRVSEPRQVRKFVTLVFSDVTGSTAIGEGRDPESIRGAMDRYFAEMRSVIERHGGTVEKFVGDAVMAAFGIPVVREDDALRAVRAAAEMRGALERLNHELETEWGVRIAVRTGVNTGEVVAGDATTRETFATGDTVNTAARLEQAAKPNEILLGHQTYRLVRDAVAVEPVEPLTLKGKTQPVAAYRLLDVTPLAPGRARGRLAVDLIGRDHELAGLRSTFERVVSGERCALVTVVGPAGVGKSRLTEEFLARIDGKATVLRGRCLSYGEGITFWPIIEVLREAADIEDEDTPEIVRTKLDALLGKRKTASLDRLTALLGATDRGGTIQETFLAARRAFESVAASRPLVLLIEDLHWAEPTLLDLLLQILQLGRAPILVLCTSRPDLLEARPDWETGGGSIVRLEPLTRTQTQLLVDTIVNDPSLEGLRDQVVQRAEGNPLFATEMLAMLIDEGSLVLEGGRWMMTTPSDRIAAPPTISALIAARLDRLPAEERDVIESAAVVGKDFDRTAIEALADAEIVSGLDAVLGRLVRKDFVVGSTAEVFSFRHILIRDEAYAATTKGRRSALHERYADWLETSAGDRVMEYEEILGFHFEQAYRYRVQIHPERPEERALARRAADRLASAGYRASARGDVMASVNLLSRAADLLPEHDPERLSLLPDLGDALIDSGDLAGARALLTDAERLATESGDDRLHAHARLALLRARRQAEPEGTGEETRQEAERCIPIFERRLDARGLARVFSELSLVNIMQCRFEAAGETLDEAVDHARRAGDRQLEGAALQWLPAALVHGPLPLEQCVKRLDTILEEGRGLPLAEGSATSMLALTHGLLGRFEGTREMFDEITESLEDLGLSLMARAGPAQPRALLEFAAGDPAAAERVLRDAYQALAAFGERSFLSTTAAMLAEALYAQGLLDEAERFAQVAEESASSDDLVTHVWARGVRAKLLAGRGHHDAARRLADEAVKIAARTDWLDGQSLSRMSQAEVLRLTGRGHEAARSVQEALRLFEAKGNVVWAARARLMSELLMARG